MIFFVTSSSSHVADGALCWAGEPFTKLLQTGGLPILLALGPWCTGWLHAFHSSRKASHLPLVMLANRAGRSDHMHCLAGAMAGMPASVHPCVLCCNGLCRISATSPLALRR